ncbi:MAG: YraN family protein [Candidatus Cloacimonadota bacterium]|nr:MAG: YraN family protein [Candidatus Cloacimonadota bacterium]
MKNELGTKGELAATNYFLKRNYFIVARNYYSRYGEIDIIALKGNRLHIIEVKSRTENEDSAISSLTRKKQLKIVKTTLHFLSKNIKFDNYFISFDLITVIFYACGKLKKINFIEDAFNGDVLNNE